MKAFTKPMGRPPTLTEELIEKIAQVVRMGMYIETAAGMNGISRACLYKWFKKAKKQKSGLYRDLVDTLKKAIDTAEVRDLMIIDQDAQGKKAVYDAKGKLINAAIPPNPKSAMWKLERRNPNHWGRKETIKMLDDGETGEEGFSSGGGSHDKIMDIIDFYNKKDQK